MKTDEQIAREATAKIAPMCFSNNAKEPVHDIILAAIREAKGEGTERSWIGWSDAARAQEGEKLAEAEMKLEYEKWALKQTGAQGGLQ